MTNEEMDRAIAEAVGWSSIEDRSAGLMMYEGFSVFGYPPKQALIGKKLTIPRYSTDLNAMHEAEKVLTDTDAYVRQLQKTTCKKDGWDDREWLWRMINATAAQRAEAFLRTIGKYHATETLP